MDILEFADAHDVEIDVRSLALTDEHVDELGLIRAPMERSKIRDKRGNLRFPWWPHQWWTVELEAVPPDDLARIVRGAIEDLQDTKVRQDLIQQERADREELRDYYDR